MSKKCFNMTSPKNIGCVKRDELKMRDGARFLGWAGPLSMFVFPINQTSMASKPAWFLSPRVATFLVRMCILANHVD